MMVGAKSLVLLMLFAAGILIIIGIYEQKLAAAEQSKKIEYRFVPRTYYDEQIGKAGDVTDKLANMFSKESPWFERVVSPFIDEKFESFSQVHVPESNSAKI